MSTITDPTPQLYLRSLTGQVIPSQLDGPVTSILTYPVIDLAGDWVRPDGGDWSDYPKHPVVNWSHDIPIGRGAVEHKSLEFGGEQTVVAVGTTTFFKSAADVEGIDRTQLDNPSSRRPVGTYTVDECLRAAADAEILVRNGLATGVSIEFLPNGPVGKAFWDLPEKSPLAPRNARHFESWKGVGYAHARQPVNPGCRTTMDGDEVMEKAIRVIESGKLGDHKFGDVVMKAFRDPSLVLAAMGNKAATIRVEGEVPKREVKGATEAMYGRNVSEPAAHDAYSVSEWAHGRLAYHGDAGPELDKFRRASTTAYSYAKQAHILSGKNHGSEDEGHLNLIANTHSFAAQHHMIASEHAPSTKDRDAHLEAFSVHHEEARRLRGPQPKQLKAVNSTCPSCSTPDSRDADDNVCTSCGYDYSPTTKSMDVTVKADGEAPKFKQGWPTRDKSLYAPMRTAAHRLSMEARDASRDYVSDVHFKRAAEAAHHLSIQGDNAGAAAAHKKVAERHLALAAKTPDTHASHHEHLELAAMHSRAAAALGRAAVNQSEVNELPAEGKQYQKPLKAGPSEFTANPDHVNASHTAFVSSQLVTGSDSHRATRYGKMAHEAARTGDLGTAIGAHRGAIQEHQKELDKGGSTYTRGRHLDAIAAHKQAIRGHLDRIRASVPSGASAPLYRPGTEPPGFTTTDNVVAGNAVTESRKITPPKSSFLGRVASRLGYGGYKSFPQGTPPMYEFDIPELRESKSLDDDDTPADPRVIARIATDLANRKSGSLPAYTVKSMMTPEQTAASHRRVAKSLGDTHPAFGPHTRAAEMWDRVAGAGTEVMTSNEVREKVGVKAAPGGTMNSVDPSIPAISSAGQGDGPPAGVRALLNFAQLLVDGSTALGYDIQSSDDVTLRVYAKSLQDKAVEMAAELKGLADKLQSRLDSPNPKVPHPLGADGDVVNTGTPAVENGQVVTPKAFPDLEFHADHAIMVKAYPEWKPRRFHVSALKDLPKTVEAKSNPNVDTEAAAELKKQLDRLAKLQKQASEIQEALAANREG